MAAPGCDGARVAAVGRPAPTQTTARQLIGRAPAEVSSQAGPLAASDGDVPGPAAHPLPAQFLAGAARRALSLGTVVAMLADAVVDAEHGGWADAGVVGLGKRISGAFS